MQPQLPAEGRDQLDLGAGQVEAGRGARTGCAPTVASTQSSMGRSCRITSYIEACRSRMLMPEAGAGVALRVEVDDEHPVAEVGQAGAQVHGRGRLAHAALLVGDGHDPGERAGERRRGSSGRRRARPARLGRRRRDGRLERHADRRARASTGRRADPRRRAGGRGAGGASGSGRSGGGGVREGLQLGVRQGRRRRPVRGVLRRPRSAAARGVAASEPLEDRPPPGGQIVRRVAHRRILPAGRPGRKDPAPMFHVEPSTWLGPRPMFHVEHASEERPLGREPVAAGVASRAGGDLLRSTCTVGAAADRAPDRRARAAASPAAGQRSGSARRAARSRRAARRRRSSGAAHSAVAAGGPKLRATTASAVPRERPAARPPRPDPRPRSRVEPQGRRRPARGTGSAWRVASSSTQREVGPGRRRGRARARRRRCPGRRPSR